MSIFDWFCPKSKAVLVYKNASQLIPNNAGTPVSWDNIEYDDAGIFHSPTKFIFPNGTQRIKLSAAITFSDAPATPSIWRAAIRKNGAPVRGQGAEQIFTTEGVYNPTLNIYTGVLKVSDGDFFEVAVTQVSGYEKNVVGEGENFFSTWFCGEVVK